MTVAPPIPRDSQCPSCGHDVRCCTNCRHYDPAFNNACRETEAEPVGDHERRNFCEYFDFDPAPFDAARAGSGRSAQARSKLDSLFGGGGSAGSSAVAKKELEGLFGGKPPAGDRAEDARRGLDRLFGAPGQAEEPESDEE